MFSVLNVYILAKGNKAFKYCKCCTELETFKYVQWGIVCGATKLSLGSFQSALCTISPGPSQERVNGDGWRRVMLFSQWISYRWAEEAECVIDAAAQESCGVGLYGEEGREGNEGRERRVWCEVFKREVQWFLKSFLSLWLWVTVHSLLMWYNLLVGLMSQATWCQLHCDQTKKSLPVNCEKQPLLSCLCLFLFVFRNIFIWASVYVKRKKGEGFVSIQKLSMIHVSSALICELCTAPG